MLLARKCSVNTGSLYSRLFSYVGNVVQASRIPNGVTNGYDVRRLERFIDMIHDLAVQQRT
jgi:hypothetical protein